jgi:hypothetical protein
LAFKIAGVKKRNIRKITLTIITQFIASKCGEGTFFQG